MSCYFMCRCLSSKVDLLYSYRQGKAERPLLGTTVGVQVEEAAEKNPDKEAFIFCNDGIRKTYEQLLKEVVFRTEHTCKRFITLILCILYCSYCSYVLIILVSVSFYAFKLYMLFYVKKRGGGKEGGRERGRETVMYKMFFTSLVPDK